MREEVYDIGGMHCAACSSAVERVTRKLNGVERSDVNLPMNRMTIVYDENLVTPEMIMTKVEKAGFSAKPHLEEKKAEAVDPDAEEKKAFQAERRQILIMSVLSVMLLYLSMGPMLVSGWPVPDILDMHTHPANYAMAQTLLTIPILYCGRRFFVSGYKSLFHGNPNMDALVAISSTASFLYSLVMMFLLTDRPEYVHHLYYESAAIVVTLVFLGKHMEAGSKQKTKSAITKLMELAPDTAILIQHDRQWEVPADTLKVGDIVLVKPGMRFPMDGVVTEGTGGADESMLTGESLPVEKTVGSPVIGGSISVNGALYVEITRVGAETTLSKIIKFVEDAQGKKAPISKTADKVAGVFVPCVIAIAVLAAVIWLAAGEPFSFALRIFTTVLVIACPCAMGLATPTAIIVGTGLGASRGILIRSGEALEITHKTQVVVLDKTGTVTEGKPKVTEAVPFHGDRDVLIVLAASVEKLSDHPLAKAVTEAAEGETFTVSSFENKTGLGISAVLEDGRKVLVGNQKLMDKAGISTIGAAETLTRLASLGQTPVLVAANDVLLGVIGIADTVKPTSRNAIAHIRAMGVKTVLLTGDHRVAAEEIGRQVGVDEVIAEVLPNDKAAVVERLQKAGQIVMMVGDGINDAPALTQADIGCAIGSGSDIAIESAEIVLTKSDLEDVPRAIHLSRLTIRNIKQNLFWAFCYNVLGIPIAAGVLYPAFGLLLSPMIGGIAMSLSSLFVVTNALRLRGKKL